MDSGLLRRPQGAVPGGEKNCAAFGIGLSMRPVQNSRTLADISVLKIRDEIDSYRVVTQVVTDG